MNYEFIEKFIFEKEKDTPFMNELNFYNFIKEKYRTKVNRDLYIKIINYQINTYGESLANSCLIDVRGHDECKRRSINANARRKRKLKGRNEN